MKSIIRPCVLTFVGVTAFASPASPATQAAGLEGTWISEQTGPASSAPLQATLNFARSESGVLKGGLKLESGELPLFDIRETGANVSFTLVMPGAPYVSVLYSGSLSGDEIRLVGADENRTVYTMTAHRIASVAAAPAQSPSNVALQNSPASQTPVVSALQPAISNASAALSARLDGLWTAEQTGAKSSASVTGNLVFTGNRGVMHAGADDWPLFDVRDTGADVTFSLVIPGTPYTTVRYAGTLAGDMLQLQGLDGDQASFHLTARRGTTAVMSNGPLIASINPPSNAQRDRPPLAASAGPPAKLPLPPLRDMPPNALFKTPPMGWASRQKLGADMEDDDIRQAAESLEETDLRSKGYTLVEIDEGWQGARDANGVLHAGAKFPDMKALADYVHSKRLKLGLAVSAAPKSCGGFEGSYGHEADDAKLFAAWGIDYIVYDWCGADSLYPSQAEQRAAYQKMSEALRASGREIAFGISQKGAFDVANWGAKAGANLWRTAPDVEDTWNSVTQAGFAENGKEANAGPGHWNDPGLLQTGNGGMTPDEYRTQLNLWAVLAAPMMLGNDVRIMTKETLATLGNAELIAIDQDSLGRQAKRVAQNGQGEVWARPLADGSIAVGFFNRGDDSVAVAVTWQQLGIEGPRRVRDVWRHDDAGMANGRYGVFLSGHSSLLLRMSR
jgi:alpha-galactosidase